MSCGDEAVHDRVYHVMVRGEKFAACRGNLDADPVVRRNQRSPRLRHVRLARHGENQSIDHLAHDAGIRLVIFNRV